MEIDYQREDYLRDQRQLAMKFWLKVARDYKKGLSAQAIADKYINPKTHKLYTRAHIYGILTILRKDKKAGK